MFLESWFLLGSLSAGIPVLIHLLARRESVRMDWPTLRFLLETERRTARRRRIEQLLLMLLRAAIMLLLAIGLARPVLRYTGAAGTDTSLVLVLDNSLSSQALEQGESVFERARAAALRILEGLDDNSLCGIVPVCKPAQPLAAGLSPGPAGAREAVRAAAPAFGRGSIPAALNKALALVKSQASARQEVYYLGDLQANGWPLAGDVTERAANAALVLVNCAAKSPQNLALERIGLSLAAPAVGSELTVEADIASHASLPLKSTITLFVNGGKRGAQELAVPPGGRSKAAFSARIESAGLHTIALETGDDALLADNRRYAGLFVPPQIRVLLASAVSDAEQERFVRCALDPFGPGGEAGSPVRIEKITSLPADAASAAAVFVIGDALATGALEVGGYLAAGGTLVVLPGSDGIAGRLLAMADMRAEWPPEAASTAVAFRRETLALPPFSTLSGLGPGAFSAIEVRRRMRLSAPADAHGVLAGNDGRPLLLLREVGAGRIFVFATAAQPGWGNLVLRGLFPLMLQQMVYQSALAGGVRGIGAEVGDALLLPATAAALDVTAPSGRVLRVPVDAGTLRPPAPEEPGVYTITRAADAGLVAFVVSNVPAIEGNLRSIPADEAVRRIERAAGKCLLVNEPAELDDALHAVRKGIPIFNYILGLVAAFVVLETFFANRIAPANAVFACVRKDGKVERIGLASGEGGIFSLPPGARRI